MNTVEIINNKCSQCGNRLSKLVICDCDIKEAHLIVCETCKTMAPGMVYKPILARYGLVCKYEWYGECRLDDTAPCENRGDDAICLISDENKTRNDNDK